MKGFEIKLAAPVGLRTLAPEEVLRARAKTG